MPIPQVHINLSRELRRKVGFEQIHVALIVGSKAEHVVAVGVRGVDTVLLIFNQVDAVACEECHRVA